MSGLAALLAGHTPPDVYQWHNAVPATDVQHAVEKAGWDFRYLDGWTIEDQATFVKSAAECLDTAIDGHDVDALAQCLGKLQQADRGLVLLWDGWSPLARHDEDTFRTAVQAFRARAEARQEPAFAVILRGDGPDLELDELPIKH